MRGSYHLCGVPGCDGMVRGAHPFCGGCFFKLTVQHRMALIDAVRTPYSVNYWAAVRAAIASLADARKARA